ETPQQSREFIVGHSPWVLLIPCMPDFRKPDTIAIRENSPRNPAVLALLHEPLGSHGGIEKIWWNQLAANLVFSFLLSGTVREIYPCHSPFPFGCSPDSSRFLERLPTPRRRAAST